MFRCTPLILPLAGGSRREATRPPQFRGAHFDEEFDSSTLLYDLIRTGARGSRHLVGVAPPFSNLFPVVCRGTLCGEPIGALISRCYFRDRCTDIWLPDPGVSTLDFEFDFGSYRLTPQESDSSLYARRRVLYTLSKDNELTWVVDWIRFHVRYHGANGVLIYDVMRRDLLARCSHGVFQQVSQIRGG
jgi:hypothetical protein